MAATYDGLTQDELQEALALPRVMLLAQVSSTMDVANGLAADGAPAGTLVLADEQLSGRGRSGRRWESPAGAGIWLTLLERVKDAAALDVLSLRAGIRAAAVLGRFAARAPGLKWPNDILLGGGKLGGILVETRWRAGRPEWTAVGVGINVREAVWPGAAALGSGVSRTHVLSELVPALRAAASARGHLSDNELAAFAARDVAVGRNCREPLAGRVAGIAPDGALLVDTNDGRRRATSGSLVMVEDS